MLVYRKVGEYVACDNCIYYKQNTDFANDRDRNVYGICSCEKLLKDIGLRNLGDSCFTKYVYKFCKGSYFKHKE